MKSAPRITLTDQERDTLMHWSRGRHKSGVVNRVASFLATDADPPKPDV